jgi:hypothetical protein
MCSRLPEPYDCIHAIADEGDPEGATAHLYLDVKPLRLETEFWFFPDHASANRISRESNQSCA